MRFLPRRDWALSEHGPVAHGGGEGVAYQVRDPRALLDDGGEASPGHAQDLELLLDLAKLRLEGPLQG